LLVGATVISEIPFFITILGGLIYLEVLSNKNEALEDEYKRLVVEKIIQPQVNTYDIYLGSVGITEEEFRQVNSERYDRYQTEDLYMGTTKNDVPFRISYVRTSIDKNNYDEPVYKGLVSVANLKKEYNGELRLVYDRNESYSAIEKIGLKKVPINIPRVEVDSSEFEMNFDVYATDEIQAMQILTSDMMEKIIAHWQEYYNFELTIKGNKLYLKMLCTEPFTYNEYGESIITEYYLEASYMKFEKVFKLIDEIEKIVDNL